MTVLARVRATIQQHGLFARGDKIVLGISGGPDSLALAHLLLALRDEWQIQLHAAHLNHQLRGAESAADAQFVARLASEWNLPATIESRDVGAYAQEHKLSVEQAAREVRYAFLAQVAQNSGAHVIAVAHNADDQVETVLMHFLRGAGMSGLRGMLHKSQHPNLRSQPQDTNSNARITTFLPFTNYELRIIRPLLDVPRAQIESYCKDNSLTPRLDRSNLDTTLFRNRLRHEALPYLESLNPNLREILLHTSQSLADDYDYLESQALDAYREVASQAEGAIIFRRKEWCELHLALQRRTLRIAIQYLRRDLRDIDWTHIEDARRIALEKGAGTIATLPHGLCLFVGYGEFVVGDEERTLPLPGVPQLHVECVPLSGGVVNLPESDWIVETATPDPHHLSLPLPKEGIGRGWTAMFDARKVMGGLALRRRSTGDRFQPAGMDGHSKSLHEFMIDEKIPRAARERLPLLVDKEKILWVCGYRVDERVRVTDETRDVLQITFRKSLSRKDAN